MIQICYPKKTSVEKQTLYFYWMEMKKERIIFRTTESDNKNFEHSIKDIDNVDISIVSSCDKDNLSHSALVNLGSDNFENQISCTKIIKTEEVDSKNYYS